jgi:hypothetical protein
LLHKQQEKWLSRHKQYTFKSHSVWTSHNNCWNLR